MTRVKICGITNVDDARMAADAGADALGCISVKGSPRYVSPLEHVSIAAVVPLFVRLVVVAHRPEDADDYLAESVQYYEEATDETRRRRGVPYRIRAFRVRGEDTLREISQYAQAVGALLLDTYHKDMLGGSGEAFNWEWAREAKALTERPLILAGGLTPENVGDALDTARPYAVDVSSGVEQSPGVKDGAKVRAFIKAVRAWDLRHG